MGFRDPCVGKKYNRMYIYIFVSFLNKTVKTTIETRHSQLSKETYKVSLYNMGRQYMRQTLACIVTDDNI